MGESTGAEADREDSYHPKDIQHGPLTRSGPYPIRRITLMYLLPHDLHSRSFRKLQQIGKSMKRSKKYPKHKSWAFDIGGNIKVRITKSRWLRRWVAIEVWLPIYRTGCDGAVETVYAYHCWKPGA